MHADDVVALENRAVGGVAARECAAMGARHCLPMLRPAKLQNDDWDTFPIRRFERRQETLGITHRLEDAADDPRLLLGQQEFKIVRDGRY